MKKHKGVYNTPPKRPGKPILLSKKKSAHSIEQLLNFFHTIGAIK